MVRLGWLVGWGRVVGIGVCLDDRGLGERRGRTKRVSTTIRGSPYLRPGNLQRRVKVQFVCLDERRRNRRVLVTL